MLRNELKLVLMGSLLLACEAAAVQGVPGVAESTRMAAACAANLAPRACDPSDCDPAACAPQACDPADCGPGSCDRSTCAFAESVSPREQALVVSSTAAAISAPTPGACDPSNCDPGVCPTTGASAAACVS